MRLRQAPERRPPTAREVWTECLVNCVYVVLAALAGGGLIVLSDTWTPFTP